jgi:hypothetical protein
VRLLRATLDERLELPPQERAELRQVALVAKDALDHEPVFAKPDLLCCRDQQRSWIVRRGVPSAARCAAASRSARASTTAASTARDRCWSRTLRDRAHERRFSTTIG